MNHLIYLACKVYHTEPSGDILTTGRKDKEYIKMKYEIGEIVEGKITGIQAYGAFVALDDDTNGLIHISEISDGYVKDITRFVRVGDTVRVKIIDIDESTNQVRLSLKALHKKRAHGRMGMFSHKATLPESKLGFLSIEKQLPIWIQEAKKGDRR